MADLIGIGQAAAAARDILGMIFPNKTEEEKGQLAAALAMVTAQTDINKAEAQSSDPLQHWRGGLGWVCTLAYANNFLIHPYVVHWWKDVPVVDIGPLALLTAGMLGLGGMHVYEKATK